MYLLALETAFGKFSLSLFKDNAVVENYFCENENEQAERLLPAIEELLARNNIGYRDLETLAVNIGPGSFTSLRIGLSAAKGIALATNVKLIGVNSLQASALKQGGGKVYLNASRGEAYFQEFGFDLEPISKPVLITYSGEFSALPDSESIGRFALLKKTDANIAPLYIRKPDAKFPLRKATDAELSLLIKIHSESFPQPWSEENLRSSIQNATCTIASNLGFIVYETIGDECELKTIAVLPSARRNGVAAYLCADMIKNSAAKKIFLEVAENNSAAIALYKTLGFKNFSTRKDYYGLGLNAVMMQLSSS